MVLDWDEAAIYLASLLATERSKLETVTGERETGMVQGRVQSLVHLSRLPELLAQERELDKQALAAREAQK